MIKPKPIPIENIQNVRPLPQVDESLEALAASIRLSGQRRPIIVDTDMNLIDGARRLVAIYLLGIPQAHVVVCSTLEETSHWLGRNFAHGELAVPLTPKRIWELYSAVHDQMMERQRRLRSRRVGIPRAEPAEPIQRSRDLFCAALGMTGEGLLAASTLVYRLLTTNQDPAKQQELDEIRDKLERGDISIYEARGAIQRIGKSNMEGDILAASDQRAALVEAVNRLSGITKSIHRIGEVNVDITDVEVQMYIKQLEITRRDLQRFITNLRKRVTVS